MSDDPAKKKPQDSSRINIHEAWEVEYWCKKFGCTKAALIAAVKAVGDSAAKVQQYLNK